ncbi:alpha/beta fold hydrolase [Prochlorococcus marinus]|uniref:alpha/beta fold hydrolase n=1 Tax=Prochlorococcus marinus TaxID=1219 RepID=UPI0022B4A99E|nr:alpha/beta hydrolase [Prochlorococcus marinus]
MELKDIFFNKELTTSKNELNKIEKELLDPLAVNLTKCVKWAYLDGLSDSKSELYPIAVVGEGKPLLLLHGFDSCFLEFRRLTPLLKDKFMLIIPDLFGFGFCPRPKHTEYGIDSIITHLKKILEVLNINSNVSLVGASMGGGIAIKLAREIPKTINKLLLLSPAGLTDPPSPIYPPFDLLGACFLKQAFVRKQLCKQAFANPKDVSAPELQIASIHTNMPGWKESLAAFARKGGISNCGLPLPKQSTKIIWGEEDRILTKSSRDKCIKLLNCSHESIPQCGHLPHIDSPYLVAKYCLEEFG